MAKLTMFVRIGPRLRAEYAERGVFAFLQLPAHIKVDGAYSIEVPVDQAREIYADAVHSYLHRRFNWDDRPSKKAYLDLVRALEDQLGLLPAFETERDRTNRKWRAENPGAPAADGCYGPWEKRQAWSAASEALARASRA